MRRDSRLIMSLAALLLAPAFLLPLWSVRIVAPQYNDGLGMFIGLTDIWGHTAHDIQNINILNHYIGMKPIDPATVDVLTIMPWVVALLMAAALLTAAIGRRWLVGGWLGAFAVLGSAGLYEFWRWNHDYGHNLDPTAPIKIPGMSYQPPLVGTKQLLNMSTSSYPSWGTLFIGLAFVAGALALINEFRPLRGGGDRGRDLGPSGGMSGLRRAAVIAVAALVGTAACAPAEGTSGAVTRAVTAEAEFRTAGVPCAYCDGLIQESRFGGRLVTREGIVHDFLSVECLAGFLLEERVPAALIASVRVVDFNHGERLIDAASAYFVRMDFERSPGGLDLAAVETEKVAGTLHYFLGGERMTWEQVLEYVAREWSL